MIEKTLKSVFKVLIFIATRWYMCCIECLQRPTFPHNPLIAHLGHPPPGSSVMGLLNFCFHQSSKKKGSWISLMQMTKVFELILNLETKLPESIIWYEFESWVFIFDIQTNNFTLFYTKNNKAKNLKAEREWSCADWKNPHLCMKWVSIREFALLSSFLKFLLSTSLLWSIMTIFLSSTRMPNPW